MGHWRTLGDVLGSLHYLGQCPCGLQHMSRNARVYVRGHETLCEACGRREEAAGVTPAPAPVPAPLEKGWGLTPRDGTRYHWSARTILRDGLVDIVWDRTGMEGDYTAAERLALTTWLDDKALPMLRHLAKHGEDFPHNSERREVTVQGDGFELRANPRASYGYLYLSAAPCATATGKTPVPPKPKPARRVARNKPARRSSW